MVPTSVHGFTANMVFKNMHWAPTGVHKTGIRGIQDTRHIVDGKTNYKENNDKKVGPDFLA